MNSHTAYASLSDIQPRNTFNYTGVAVADLENNFNIQETQEEITLEDVEEAVTGVKRQLEEEEVGQCKVIIIIIIIIVIILIIIIKVIIVDSSGATTGEFTASGDFSDPFEIPLGGSAETVTESKPPVWTQAPGSGVRVMQLPESPVERVADTPRPTSSNPSMDDWPGSHMFDVSFTKWSQGTRNKHWDYSAQLKKLFIDMNKWVQVEFRVGASISPGELYIRALPVYCDASR